MLKNLRKFLLTQLPIKISQGNYSSYSTFGKDIEDDISDLIEQYLTQKNITYRAIRAETKNDFPDLELTLKNTSFAIEYKSGCYENEGKKSSGPANDLGTLNSFPSHIKEFGDRVICIYLKYSINQNIIKIDDIYIDNIYKFVGKNKDKHKLILKYRLKDGNLRPKNWNDFDNQTYYFKTLDSFKNALALTNIHRSRQLTLNNLEKLNLKELLECKRKINLLISSKKKKKHT
jgi:hypothetical protein